MLHDAPSLLQPPFEVEPPDVEPEVVPLEVDPDVVEPEVEPPDVDPDVVEPEVEFEPDVVDVLEPGSSRWRHTDLGCWASMR